MYNSLVFFLLRNALLTSIFLMVHLHDKVIVRIILTIPNLTTGLNVSTWLKLVTCRKPLATILVLSSSSYSSSNSFTQKGHLLPIIFLPRGVGTRHQVLFLTSSLYSHLIAWYHHLSLSSFLTILGTFN